MNVLVYDGPGVSQASLSLTISSLKSLLQPNFVVQTVSPKALTSEPWAPSCALLVIPGGRDLPYLSALDQAIPRIKEYVLQGGSYLGFCAGAYFASARVEWEIGTDLEVQGDRPLRFFPGTSRGCVYPGFQYNNENGARTVIARLPNGQLRSGIYYNGGGEFIMPSSVTGVTPLAYYEDEEHPGMVAGVMCAVGKGKAALWHMHLEYPIDDPATIAASARVSTPLSSEQIVQAEAGRKDLLRETLDELGLKVSPKRYTPPTEPLPQYLCASTSCPELVGSTEKSLKGLENPTSGIIEDVNDKFMVHQLDPTGRSQIPNPTSAETTPIRHIVTCKDSLPQKDVTPHFSVSEYFTKLAEERGSRPSSPSAPLHCELGELLLYGEAITSTQTLLERQVCN
jgi:biotin--protein ligase